MCGIIDDILPILGAVGGGLLLGPAGLGLTSAAVGAGVGGAVGGFAGNYAQNHNFLGGLEGAATGGLGGYFGGGSLANALSGLGNAGIGAATTAFDTGLAANVAPTTLGSLESATGGAGLFGAGAGTGTAIGSAANALGGAGLGVAGGGALSGISDTGGSFLGGLGGGTQGTGLGIGGPTGSSADLSGVISGTSGGGTVGTSGTALPSPTSTMNATGTTGITNPMSPTGPTTSPAGSNLLEGSQSANPASVANTGGGVSLEGGQAAMNPAQSPGAMAALFGPGSTAPESAIGQGIASTGGEVGGQGVQFGALGEGTAAAPGNILGATHMGETDIPGQSIGANYDASANSAAQGNSFLNQLLSGQLGNLQGANPWMSLGRTGIGMLQNYENQRAQNAYADSIRNIFSPTGAYAKQMQSNIARQYAAMGKNAEKGPQGVQLAAALAQAQANALSGANYNRAATTTTGAPGMMLNNLLYNFPNTTYGNQALGAIGTGLQNGWTSLANLFGG